MNGPPKEMAARENLGGQVKTVPGGSGKANDNALARTAQAPEYGNSRRRFLIYAVMCGFAPPQRVVERVIAELEAETT